MCRDDLARTAKSRETEAWRSMVLITANAMKLQELCAEPDVGAKARTLATVIQLDMLRVNALLSEAKGLREGAAVLGR